MKIKRFNENSQETPEVGDYVLVKIDVSNSSLSYKNELMDYINNTIGQICKIRNQLGDIVIVYDNIPNEIKSWFKYSYEYNYNSENFVGYGSYTRAIDKNKIVAFGKTIEEVELKISAKKYNL